MKKDKPTCQSCNNYQNGYCTNFGKEVDDEHVCKFYRCDACLKEMGDRLNREDLSKAEFCRCFLHFKGFLSHKENKRVKKRIQKWRVENGVTSDEIKEYSVDIIVRQKNRNKNGTV